MPPIDVLNAPAKLTRTLRVVGIRDDGYHLLEAEMATVDLADELEIEQGEDGLEIVDEVAWILPERPIAPGATRAEAAGAFRGDSSAGIVPGGPLNLVTRALAATGRRARVRLSKRVPAGAGLGGGSADAAAVLRWAGELDPAVASQLGADVPFCVVGGRAMVTGTGEKIEPLAHEAFTAVLVTPALSVSTADVYRAWDALGGPAGDHENDLEPAALVVEPLLVWWRDLLSDVAGDTPRLAGSGGTWYFEREPEPAKRLVASITAAVRAEGVRAVVTAAASTPKSGGRASA